MVYILGFHIDDANEEEFSRHGVSARQIDDTLDREYFVQKNNKKGTCTHKLLGRDSSGICIAIPIMKTHEHGIWRPCTAWRCSDAELALLKEWKGEKR
jgi:hypothetical protein